MQPAPSFRDPAGVCFVWGHQVLRLVNSGNVAGLEKLLNSGSGRRMLTDQRLVSTRRLPAEEVSRLGEQPELKATLATLGPGQWFEHERIAFPSFPFEWPPEMLFAAARLTLDLAQATLADGFGLKDATPYNVLFRGCQPVFIDVLSFEERDAGDPVWKPYAQFVRTFLLPLLANRAWGVRLADVFATRRDGLEPEEAYRWCGPLQRFLPPYLPLISLPTWLARGKQGPGIYREQTGADPEKVRFILESLFNRLRRTLESLQPRAGRKSAWSDYMATNSYDEPTFAAKQQFVTGVLGEFRPGRVLDVGANTGHFSVLAAEAGAQVVAIDLDPVCVGALWRQAHARQLAILPLVVDLSRPSPGLGWRNRECAPFLERARNGFDCVLMLAVLHHLLVSERVPLRSILELAAELTRELLVIEFVAPADEMFQRLTRGRDHLFADFNRTVFEETCRPLFEIVRSVHLEGTHRWLYLLRRRGAAR